MPGNDYNDIYDTTIYTDFYDLPAESKKALLKEYLSTSKEDRRLMRIVVYVPLAISLVVLVLIIASMITSLVGGVNVPFIILLITSVLVLGILIITNIKMGRYRREVEERFIVWLRVEKRIIAELKSK